jgi:hypothetical protein
MIRLVVVLVVFILAMILGHCSVQAQTPIVSQNILTPSVDAWTGTVTGQAGGLSGGGTGPAYNPNTNTIIFGYTQSTTTQTISAQMFALQHAFDLSNAGIKINGYNYSWQIDNSGQQNGSLIGKVDLKSGGEIVRSYTYDYSRPTDGFELKKGTETFDAAHTLLNNDSISLSFSGKDSKFWAGYWGPRVRDPSLTLNYTADICSSNPLASASCPNYASAYQSQMCTANPTYNSACPGYAEALFTRQCTANPLSDSSCPTYASAYLTYQCSINPLYSTTCPGYEQAYLDSQCIKDSLYSRKCEGYNTAYAIKYLVTGIDSTVVNQSLSDTAATKANDPATTRVAVNTVTTTINTDGSISTGASVTGDTNVDKAITAKASTTNTAPAAVQLAPPPPPPQQQMAQNEPKGGDKPEPKGGNDKQEDKKDDAPKSTGGSSPPPNTNNAQASSDKPAAPTVRQEIQAKREAAAKADAIEKGKNLAGEMGKASDLEAQKAVQNVVIQAMGFTPGFDAYSKQLIVQQQFYKPYQVYGNQKTIDNRANLRMFGGTDKLHDEMVEKQYESK